MFARRCPFFRNIHGTTHRQIRFVLTTPPSAAAARRKPDEQQHFARTPAPPPQPSCGLGPSNFKVPTPSTGEDEFLHEAALDCGDAEEAGPDCLLIVHTRLILLPGLALDCMLIVYLNTTAAAASLLVAAVPGLTQCPLFKLNCPL